MPVYLYRNLVTGETFEYEQRMADDALTTDPKTGEPVKRLIQPVGIVFKGSGFYINDSRSGGKKESASKTESAPKESSSREGSSKAGSSKAGSSPAPASGAASASSSPSSASAD